MIFTRACEFLPGSATVSSASAGTHFDHPWPVSACTALPPAMSLSSFDVPGRMARRISVFAPVAFLARLAVLVPRPRVNLVLYYGVLAPRAAWRAAVVPRSSPVVAASSETGTGPGTGRGWRWADLMRRVFAIDVLACPGCGGRLRLIAVIEASAATARILAHLHLPAEVPAPVPSRASPATDDWGD